MRIKGGEMTLRFLKLALMAAFILVHTNCGSESQNSSAVPPPPAATPQPLKGEKELQGVWRSKCRPGKLEGLIALVNIGITQVSELTINGDEVTERSIVTSGSCSKPDIEIISTGTYTTGPTVKAGIKTIDMKLGKFKVKPVTEFGMRILNLSAFCDIKNWKIGVVREINVEEEKEFCLPKPRVQTVYSVERNRLYFGIERVPADEEERKVQLRRDWYFTLMQ